MPSDPLQSLVLWVPEWTLFCEMWALCVILVCTLPLLTTTEKTVIYTNGWIPVSSETVYDQIKRENAKIPPYTTNRNIQPINTDVSKIISSQNKRLEVDVEDISTFDTVCQNEDRINCPTKKLFLSQKTEPEFEFTLNESHLSKQNDPVEKATRRSKKIAEFNVKDYVQQLLSNEESSENPKEKAYKVTEEEIEQENVETKDLGYKYDVPKKQNESSILFDILAKYKIGKDDNLPNYALSRRQKVHIPPKQNLSVKPFQNKLFLKYNSLNHLPVDPLIAVFLSNYGYYLQGMYGINNRYNNLYGYLASNNIHNNKPFGFYKVFSDTDSSH